MSPNVLYEELTPEEFSKRLKESPIAYIPLGTLEWHGKHLPLGADGLQSRGFFIKLAERVGGIVLPMLFLGPDISKKGKDNVFYGMDIHGFEQGSPEQLPGSAYWIEDELYIRMMEAILKQLKRAGFRMVVAHGHGPSTGLFKKHIDKWSKEFGLKLFVCWREDETDGLGIQTDHAAANETSLMMHLYPELVKMERLPESSECWPLGVSGKDPRMYADPQIGRKAVELQLERMARILKKEMEKLNKI